ncbi:VOC family protein [Streptomyces marincola]|uniref:VOC family protein n=1 Tax=Streptomyces marincola TaxID=2878388 RepID=UPI001CF43F96|nr:VOC family protein [Streptomyces marincola]UCM88984.1 VOC family protein [Streptomyces marincola]
MSDPFVFIVHVTDAPASARFYGDLLGVSPAFTSPRFIAFDLADRVQLAVWSGAVEVARSTPRTSEVCVALPGGPEVIDERYRAWVAKGVEVVQEPRDEVFGRTFVVADPDGNHIRVAPAD